MRRWRSLSTRRMLCVAPKVTFLRRNARPLRVVQYEPSGLGGFCHYTYELAEALTRQGCDVTLVTTSGYELESLPRHFRTMFLFRRSRTKRDPGSNRTARATLSATCAACAESL